MKFTRTAYAWMAVLALCWLAAALGIGWSRARRAEAEQALAAATQRTLQMQAEYQALAEDAAAAEQLRAGIGAAAWDRLRAPPPRAALVAALRRIGQEVGLQEFSLSLGSAAQAPEARGLDPKLWPLTRSPIAIKAQAAADAPIFAFVQRALHELPGIVRLDAITIQRADAAKPVIDAAITLRWLAFGDAPQAELARSR